MRALKGIIVSSKMNKTATVLVERFYIHPSFKKRVQARKKYHADNEIGAKVGQKIEMVQCRPLSKTKKWKITKILSKQP